MPAPFSPPSSLRQGYGRQAGPTTGSFNGLHPKSKFLAAIGILGGMAPNRRQEIARLGIEAIIAATLANLTSVAITGLFVLAT